MPVLKGFIGLVLVAVVAVACVLFLVDAWGVHSPLFAFLANCVAMACIAIAGQFLPISFPPAYYAPRRFERTGRIYELLGVRLFKALVRRGPLTILSPTLHFPPERTAPALRALDGEMRKAEAGHVLIFLLILIAAGYFLLRGWLDAAAWLVLFSVPINLYPVMLQRYNRIKLQALIDGTAAHPTDQDRPVSPGLVA